MRWFVIHYVVPTFSNATERISILDVGSYNVNGTYKPMFDPQYFAYTGIDMVEGDNVDIVVKPYDWSIIPTDSYDVVICGQVLEHAEFFWQTMSEMTRVLKQGGLLCVIVPNECLEHRFPVDCYRFYTDGMVAMARYNCLDILHAHTNCYPPDEIDGKPTEWCYRTVDNKGTSVGLVDSMLIARKPYSGVTRIIDLKEYTCVPAVHTELSTGLIQAE